MKGLIKVTPESLIKITDECCIYMRNFNIEPYKTIEYRFVWRKLKKVPFNVYSGLPFWYQHKHALFVHMHKLHDVADNSIKTGDEIYLSQMSYTHLVMLANGDKHANPIYIMNY